MTRTRKDSATGTSELIRWLLSDFLETMGFTSDYVPDPPYQSWGTEYVYVVDNQPEYISLQHIMVMRFKQPDASLSEPVVIKHWRQDWRYQDTQLLEYRHRNTWATRRISKRAARGKWTQAVFQVDDSPRYESIGKWQHNASFSSWRSERTRRPLPRREYSVRDDYDVLEGFNTHVVTKQGWQQVEENWKLRTGEKGAPDEKLPYLAKEQGLARYQRITGFDFSEGDEYMRKTGQFWQDVRQHWQSIFQSHPDLRLKKAVDDKPLFIPLFAYAESITKAGNHDPDKAGQAAREIIYKYLEGQ